MADPLKLQALTLIAIQDATKAYLNGGSISKWEQDMRTALVRGHTAAYLAGLAERLGVQVDTALVSERRLSKIERAELKEYLKRQLAFFDGFVADVRRGKLSPAQIAARADLYSGATRATYFDTRWGDWEIPFSPGDGGTPCLGRCRCGCEVIDNGDGTGKYNYVMGATEQHCTVCPERAAGSPYSVKRRKIV